MAFNMKSARNAASDPPDPNAGRAVSRSALNQVMSDGANLGPGMVSRYRQLRARQIGLRDGERYRPSTGMDVLYEIYVNNLLSGPQTHFTNILSNSVQTALGPIDTAARAAVTMFSKPQDKVYLSEVVGDIYGTTLGIVKAAQYMGSRAMSKAPGVTEVAEQTAAKYGISSGILNSTRLDYVNRRISSQNFSLDEDSVLGKISDGIGAMVNMPASALNMGDIAYKIIHDTRAKTRWAAHEVAVGNFKSHADAMKEATTNLDVSRRAIQEAEYYTFTGRPNMPMFSWITDADIEKLPGMRWVIPFKRTIANIAEQTLERSPLALAVPSLAKRLAHKDPAERAAAQARLLAGTGLLVAGSVLFGDNLVGAAPRNKLGKEMFDRTYGGEFAINFEDGAIKLDELGVVGQQLKAIAMYRQAIETTPEALLKPENAEQLMERLAVFIAPITETLYSNHYAENLSQFFNVFDRAREMKSVAPIAQWAERLAVRTIPVAGSTAWEQAQRSMNPQQKDAARLGAQLQMLFPKQRELVRDAYTFDGKPMIVNNYRGLDSKHPLNPYDPNDKLARTFNELGMEFKDRPDEIAAFSPGKVDGQDIQPRKVKLSDDQWDLQHKWIAEGRKIDPNNPEDRFGKVLGNLPPFRDYMLERINHPSWKTMPKDLQQEALRQRRERYNGALNEHLRSIPELRKQLIETTIQHKKDLAGQLKLSEGQQ